MFERRKKKSLFANINITPFVDVVLVLLIIFMVTVPLMQSGIEVELPQSKGKELKTEENELIITITKDESLFLNKKEMPLDKLVQKLPALIKERKNKDVYLRADKNVTYGFVIKVMGMLKEAGIDRLGMITEPIEEKK